MNDAPSPTPRPRRLIILCGALALFQAGAAAQALTLPPAAAELVSLPLALQFVAGGVWALIFGCIVVTLIQTQPHSRRWAWWAVAGFATYSVLRLLLFAQADYDRERLPFLLLLMFSFLAITAAYTLRRSSNGEMTYGSKS